MLFTYVRYRNMLVANVSSVNFFPIVYEMIVAGNEVLTVAENLVETRRRYVFELNCNFI